jgi:hypothetical protein
MEHELSCTNCESTFSPVRHRKARWAAAGAGALIGLVATQNLFGGMMGGAIGYLVAAGVDRYHFARLCPQCGSLAQHPTAEERGEGVHEEAPAAA